MYPVIGYMQITEVKDILRKFASPAVMLGTLSQAQLDRAIDSITEEVPIERERLITFREAASQLEISSKTVSRMVEAGELQSKRLRASCAKSARIFQSSVTKILTPETEEAA